MNDKQWHEEVCKRDKWICRFCRKNFNYPCYFKTSVNTMVCGHHVKSKGSHTELRHDVNNGICVCKKCHTKKHAGNIKMDFINFTS